MEEQNRMTITTGMVLGNRYQIVRLIGEGGMALVYLAVDQRTGRDVAVKVLKSELAQDEEFVRRFDTEAKAASSLSHPNIVKVLGVGEEAGMRYMIQEYVEGTTLKELIDHYGRLDWRVAVPIGIQVAMALENAHAADIVHRDIKPHNIMVTPDRRALVTDFGIARASTSSTITLTSGNAMGSVHYFSPEQARGGMVGAKADIYSLGIVFYEMLTGDVPFDGDTPVAVAIKHLQEQPEYPRDLAPEIPEGLADIVMKCIRKSPAERYESARDLIDELDQFMLNPEGVYGQIDAAAAMRAETQQLDTLGEGTNYHKVREIEATIRSRSRGRKREMGIVLTAVAVCALLLIVGVVFIIRSLNRQPAQTEDYVMKNFVSMRIDEAVAELKRAGITPEIKYVPSADIEKDIVMSQKPNEGDTLKPTSLQKVELVVSEGAQALTLKNYAGQNFAAVSTELKNAGYTVSPVYEDSDTVAMNLVIRTDPEPDTILEPGQSITLYISTGKKEVELPDLRGKPRESVLSMLEQMGLHVEVTLLSANPNLPAADQYVVNYSPEAGTRLAAGSTVYITFGSYTDAYPELTATTTAQPTTTTEPTTTAEPTTSPSATTESTTQPTTAPSVTSTPSGTTAGTETTPSTPAESPSAAH